MKTKSIATIIAFGLGLTCLNANATDTGSMQVHNASGENLLFVCKFSGIPVINDTIKNGDDSPLRSWNKAPLSMLAAMGGTVTCQFSDSDTSKSLGTATINSDKQDTKYSVSLQNVPFSVTGNDGQKGNTLTFDREAAVIVSVNKNT
jgi:hypothetical protein